MTGRTPEKGQSYIEALDTARCNDSWNDVPELVRKIEKHCPERRCLIEVARTEYHVVSYLNKRPNTASTGSGSTETKLHDLIPGLLSVMEEEGSLPQDVFQAQVCLGWLHWTLSEPALASSRLPKDFDVTLRRLFGDEQVLSPWTEVCIIKGGYMKGAAQALVSGPEDAIRTFKLVLPWISAPSSTSPSNPQFLFWSEQLLARAALLASEAASEGPLANEQTAEFALKAFRLWAAHRNVQQGDPASDVVSTAPASPGSRASIWKAYYTYLSSTLYQVAYTSPSESQRRVQLTTEIRRVEAICENVVIKNTTFPKAEAKNTEVEAWVEQFIQNWEVLCGSGWRDGDFGEGGHDAFSRNVLDMLYRAATVTFHSTLILRRLFHVHAALAEFNLAIKALETYIDLTTSAKARAKKSPEAAGELEDNETFALTLSEGITMLSCFGSYKEAEKAKELTDMLQKLLNELVCNNSTTNSTKPPVSEEPTAIFSHGETLSPTTFSIAYRAIGIGLANWARWTPINEARTDIQTDGIAALERSLNFGSPEETDVASTFALALLLAETRDIDGAIDCVRTALLSAQSVDSGAQGQSHWVSIKERDLVPLWHLLALLLSAKQDFEAANKTCIAAFNSVPSVNFLHEPDEKLSQHKKQDSGEKAAHWLSTAAIEESRGTPNEMEAREKESIVELRITQLKLLEILHGPEYALNQSEELLSLYGRLFTDLEFDRKNDPKRSDNLIPPKSSAGTTRSFRGSIFGRRKSVKYVEKASSFRIEPNMTPRVPSTSSGGVSIDPDAPTIQVTDEDRPASSEHPHPVGTGGSTQHRIHRRDGSMKSVRPHSLDRTARSTRPNTIKKHKRQNAGENSPISGDVLPQADRSEDPPSPSHALTRNGSHKTPNEESISSCCPKSNLLRWGQLSRSVRFDSPTRALTRFPKVQTQIQAHGLLIKIWLFIAGLYRHAALFEDALEACNEASEQARCVESLIAGQESSARAFADSGWGGTKSSDELWGDVYAERGRLALATARPYDAINHFEDALMYYPDHISATVGLANLLLDIYDQTLPLEKSEPDLDTNMPGVSLLSYSSKFEASPKPHDGEPTQGSGGPSPSQESTPEALDRLAARDRAYGLLSALTKLGSAWDNSEAWFALSRAYEQSGQINKAKKVLWWCVELEDRRPIRHWWNVGSGGYVL
ncbi:filamentation protein [Histoplasma capsulatum var. duboisii H88]|uniref:Filamentation protein n=1 Tax=Ajellomyces capsulatus (strain H88) TaxID=544711 RepID=F0USM6_AJEC8|nr:filamentation protein [Histoplasma capsulatum var. duboisii H88]QSS54500.1 filamentation protein [Histoplasma capsulatum var. duboisii H88]